LNINKTALLLIDLQKEKGTSDIVGMEEIVARTQSLIETCRAQSIPVIYTRHINRGDGVGLANNEPVNETGSPLYYNSDTDAIDILDEVAPTSSDIVIDKSRYSGFFESSLDARLKELDIQHLLIGGVLTDVCVLATVNDAFSLNYQVNLISDLSGTTSEGAHMAATLIMANWIYDLKIFQASQMQNLLKGKEYQVWETAAPDELNFAPESMKDAFKRIKKH